MFRSHKTIDDPAIDAARGCPAPVVVDSAILDEAERLLSGRTRDIRLGGTMRTLYRERTWPQTSQMIRAWMVWVFLLDILSIFLNFSFLPSAKAVQALVPGGIVAVAAAAVSTVWRGRGIPLAQELSLTGGTFVILFAITLVGAIAGPDFYERYTNIMIFTAVTAIIIFGVSITWTWAIAGTALFLHAGFQVWNPTVSIWSALATTAFFGTGLVGTVLGRRSVTITAQKSFLLGLRDLRRVSELAEANSRLETLARTDPLTGVANRRWMTETMDRLWDGRPSPAGGVAVLMCDVDHFKGLNDALGHLEGDRCLREVANAIADSVRPGLDHVARYGGEEFLVLLTGVDVFEATLTAERICRTMEASLIANPGSAVSRYVTISIGLAVSNEGTPLSPERLQRRADDALYRAKATGRNRVVAWDPLDSRQPAQTPILAQTSILALSGPAR